MTRSENSWVGDALSGLARGDASTFRHLLVEHDTPVELENTKTTVRTHFVAHDVSGVPVIDKLALAMALAMVDFCVPRARVERAKQELIRSGSTAGLVRLTKQAEELFVKAEKSGEGGELLLFMLMEQVLGLPQILSKMSLKTNSNMHVHGSDGVHAQMTPDGVLDLFWGESKLYKSSSAAFTECFTSIAPFLASDSGDARKRDLLLVHDHINIQEADLAAHLIAYFDDEDPHSLRVRWNGVCLVGFDYDSYPNLSTIDDQQRQAVKDSAASWHTAVTDRVTKNSLLEVRLDVFCIPFPSVEALRKAISKAIGSAN